MEELEFEGSFISWVDLRTPATFLDIDGKESVAQCDTPFEIIMGNKYFGNQTLTNEQAKAIADFIYAKLGLSK